MRPRAHARRPRCSARTAGQVPATTVEHAGSRPTPTWLTQADTFTISGCAFTLPTGQPSPCMNGAVDDGRPARHGRAADAERVRYRAVLQRGQNVPQGPVVDRQHPGAGHDGVTEPMQPIRTASATRSRVDPAPAGWRRSPTTPPHVEQMIAPGAADRTGRADQPARLRLRPAPHGVRAELRAPRRSCSRSWWCRRSNAGSPVS